MVTVDTSLGQFAGSSSIIGHLLTISSKVPLRAAVSGEVSIAPLVAAAVQFVSHAIHLQIGGSTAAQTTGVGAADGTAVGIAVGIKVGIAVGEFVGKVLGAYDG